jgi:hypothetical protein
MTNAERSSWIREVLSTPRFAPYLAKTGGDTAAAVQLYWWNVKVSESFYTPLHCLELALRNSMHGRLRNRFGRPDWWSAAELTAYGTRTVSAAEQKLISRSSRPFGADDIVAELPFGFWVSLVSRGASYDRTLWVPALHLAFPHYHGRRQPLYDNLQAVVLLRNRIMHHEPIHHRHLEADHDKIYRLIAYISPIMAKELEALDRVNEVLGKRPPRRR